MQRSLSPWTWYVGSATLNGTVNFTDMSNWPNPRGIVWSRLINGNYAASEKLEGGVNTPRFGTHPCIAPDESSIIFDFFRDTEKEKGRWPVLYVCFRNRDGTWGKAIYLGDELNHKGLNLGVSLSPDGKYLFYSHDNDIYWVDARIIEELKLEESKEKEENDESYQNNYHHMDDSAFFGNAIISPGRW